MIPKDFKEAYEMQEKQIEKEPTAKPTPDLSPVKGDTEDKEKVEGTEKVGAGDEQTEEKELLPDAELCEAYKKKRK